MKVPYRAIVLLLIGITVLSLGLTALGGVRSADNSDDLSVVASFYPMYTATLRVVGDVSGVTVHCLTRPATGCLHDYQLSPTERMSLEKADLLILNGGGTESFLEHTLTQIEATVVDTTAEVALTEAHDVHEHEGHEHHANEHGWMSPLIYAEQVQAICEALCKADAENAETYRANAARYRREIDEIGRQFEALSAQLPFDKAVLFHDSLAYTAEELGLTVVGTLPIGEEGTLSAHEIRTVADAIQGQAVLFLYDEQYTVQQEGLMSYAAHSAGVSLNSAVRPMKGVAPEDVWVAAMRQNISVLEEVAK